MMTAPITPRPARIVGFGELLLRLASQPPRLLFQDMHLEASFCGAEGNVMVGLAGFGHPCRLVTALPDNAVGQAACGYFEAMRVATAVEKVAASRLGLLYLQPGAMTRPSSITYDRSNSAFAMVEPAVFDWPSLLYGTEWLFVSGITAALGDGPLMSLQNAITAARKAGVKIAFDTNFRPTLWQGREDQAARILRDLSCQADLIFAGRRAVAMMAGGSFDHADPDEGFHAAAEKMLALAPSLNHIAATRRNVLSTDRQELTGLLADREGLSISPTVALENIVDRVGTGDAFAAGIMHGLLTGMSRSGSVNFATACSQWAHSVPGDFLRASVDDIVRLESGSSDVKR